MTKITERSGLNVDTELVIDEVGRTFQLVETGNLVAKDGVSIQALYGKFVDLWATVDYQDSPFPMNALDALSGQYLFGIDAGGNANGWTPLDDTTRQMLRDGGWEEYDSTGTLLRIYTGIVGLGSISDGAQAYYQVSSDDEPTSFTFTDQVNQGIQVYGDENNGDFDKRTFFKAFVREQGKSFSDSILSDTGKTSTGAYIVNMLLSDDDDLNIEDEDTEMLDSPYLGITVEYFDENQTREIGGTSYEYNVIIDGNDATLEQIYTKIQYLLRQNEDIDSGDGSVNGKTASLLLDFVGDTLETTYGVYVDNIQSADSNRISFRDLDNIQRENPFESSGTLNFNDIMIGDSSSYRLMYSADYGTADAVTVLDADGEEISGVITANSISFTYDYDNSVLGGDAKTDKEVTLIGINPNSSKFAVATGTITSSKLISLTLVAETDYAYS